MADYKAFKDVFKKLDKSLNAAKVSAAKKAATSTKAKLAKDIKASTGLASAKTKKRVKIYKADTEGVVMSIGIRKFFAAHEFSPKKVKITTLKGIRYGATYQVKGKSRIKVDGAFLVTAKSSGKTVMVQRKGDARYPLATVVVDVFSGAVLAIKPDLQKHMVDTFKKNFESDLAFRMSKK